jgi:membrane protease YdiL (CAAX protease family)
MVARFMGTLGLAPLLENALVADMLAILIGFPAAGWIVARYGQANGIDAQDWEYRWTVTAVAFGALAGFIAYGVMWGTALVDQAIWGVPPAVPAGFAEALQGGAWVAVVMLAANGIAGPIGEELAWRGVVQTALLRVWGPVAAIVVTGVLFALKHVALDGSLARITTLVMLGLVLGLVRHRWGTGSSTVAHVVANLLATSEVIAST